MKKKLFIAIIVLSIYSCRTIGEIDHREKETTRVIREVERDTTVVVTADSAWLKAWLECDSTGQVIMRELLDYRSGKHLQISEIKIVDNILMAKATVDSFGVYLTLHDRYETCISSDVISIDRMIKVNHLKWWQKSLMGIGCIAIILVCIQFRK